MTNAALLRSIDSEYDEDGFRARLGSTSIECDQLEEARSSGYWRPIQDRDIGRLGWSFLSNEDYDTKHDDPVIVSDDDQIVRARHARIQKMQAMHNHFALHPTMARGRTESVLLQEKSLNSSFLEMYDALISSTLASTPDSKLAEYEFSKLPATTALQFIRNAANAVIMGKEASAYPKLLDESRQKFLMNSYRVILDPIFEEMDFSPTDTYEDGIGGVIVDYLRAEARICVALADDQIQFFYKKGNEFASKVFDYPETAKIDVLEFVQTEFA